MSKLLLEVQAVVDAVKAAGEGNDPQQNAMTDLIGLIANGVTRQAEAMERIANTLEEKNK